MHSDVDDVVSPREEGQKLFGDYRVSLSRKIVGIRLHLAEYFSIVMLEHWLIARGVDLGARTID